ncbi:hypothetical protein [Methylicorpusculum sp.]|uniref:hypothetical protein n=1 Tax=Methylicorpusculum sp. TaxID=2713644 RepID=UPI00272D671A|nr:hypothetical protein [Methylicorpusculum sp.]
MDSRLNDRYQRLVIEHMNSSERLSAGLKALPDKISSFASTQAAWRFYQNESVSLSKRQEPLTVAAHHGILAHCMNFALCVHDWSRLSYKHANKPDTYAITHDTDIGYDLQTSLIISDQTGQPLAPVAQRLVSSEGSFSTYQEATPQPIVQNHLDEVSDCIQFLDGQGFAKPLVHLIDREGDSIGHIRRWEATDSHWLVRVKDNPKVDCQAKPMACKAVAQGLAFSKTREVRYQGQTYWQWVAETDVTLTRPAKPSQQKSKKPAVPGIPVAARLVVSRVLSDEGDVLAEWLLLTNVKDVDASTIALWYYWRWQIEIDQPYCLHKSVFRKLLYRFCNWFYPGTINSPQFT